ncbi:MAG: site-specific DNA-methyltransferase [Mangrovibacterium sp.]|nr:site-specific DNA-methyltransferase [Mangrovibacterium sp.]
MANNISHKLELTWVGKGEEPKLEPRILIENPDYSYGENDTPNLLIHGDNLLALKALEQDYAGRVKCIYIDPPYNTGNAFEHYDDGLEHSQWLNLMYPRIKLLRNLLSEDGSIWISIDDDESHYLKVLCDEVFGRGNFVANIVWQKKYGPANDAKWFSDSHDHILVYAKNKSIWRPNLIPRTEEQLRDYKNPDNDRRGPWRASDLSAKTPSESCMYSIKGPTGLDFSPPPTRSWIVSRERFNELITDNRIWWGTSKTGRPMMKKFLSEVKGGITPETWWSRDVAADNKIAKYESKKIYNGDSFATPKPEKLLERILMIATNSGDAILDSFLGSATAIAVAHKMGRKWIGIELGNHAYTHCYPRMQKVIDGEQGGISKSVDWKGGGGFKFYTLTPSLLNQDGYGNWVISKDYNADMLAAAMAKHEGFRYQPDGQAYWKQGQSSEKDYLYTTTLFITVEMLDRIHDEMRQQESLLICCKAFQPECENRYANISIKKIPHVLLGKCEFGKDDYSLNIINLPEDEDRNETEFANEDPEVVEDMDVSKNNLKSVKSRTIQQSLFD